MYAYLLTGSNIGEKECNLKKAYELITDHYKILNSSKIIESEAWGFHSENSFLNQCIVIDFSEDPLELLNTLLRFEKQIGRRRINKKGYQSRIIDIDILLIDDMEIVTEKLTVPHPKVHLRRFALEALNNINPSIFHPRLKSTVKDLLEDCPDNSDVTIW